VETVLFLQAIALQSSGTVSFWGGLSGAALALGVTSVIFIGGRRIPLKALFRSTGAVLLFVAAGLLAYGIHELEELGWVPSLIAPVWTINHLLNEKEGLGSFLKALFGYNGNPSLTEVLSYATYLTVILWALRRWRQRATTPPTVTR
jgi:high-affinity iron transporter